MWIYQLCYLAGDNFLLINNCPLLIVSAHLKEEKAIVKKEVRRLAHDPRKRMTRRTRGREPQRDGTRPSVPQSSLQGHGRPRGKVRNVSPASIATTTRAQVADACQKWQKQNKGQKITNTCKKNEYIYRYEYMACSCLSFGQYIRLMVAMRRFV